MYAMIPATIQIEKHHKNNLPIVHLRQALLNDPLDPMDTYSLNIDSRHHRTLFRIVAQRPAAPTNQSAQFQ